MFIDNKYTRWYMDIINFAKTRSLTGYGELHHIIPRCLGGSEDKSNIILLTAREHFICHLLLTKMNDSQKLKYAVIMMTTRNEYQNNRYIPNSRIYEIIRKLNSKLASERFKGNQKHNVGKKSAYDPVSLKSKMFKSLNDIPNGWILGASPNTKLAQKGKNKGKIYYNNPLTGESIALNKDESPPNGWIKGNPNAGNPTSTGTILCHNPITGESKRFKDIPAGWTKGSIYVWATDGITNIQIKMNQQLPEGYRYGRSVRSRQCKSH